MDDGINSNRAQPVTVKQWTLDNPVTELTGLWHLEGEEVSILGDGEVFEPQTVVDGMVTLPKAVTRAIVGLAFTCRAKTLPQTTQGAVIENKRKRVTGLAVRLDRSCGTQSGRSLKELYPLRERVNQTIGDYTRLINGIEYQLISSNWDADGQTYFVQTDPLPVTLLSLTQEVEIGDDPD